MSTWGSSDWLQDAKRDGLAAVRLIQHPRNVSVMPFTQLAEEAEKGVDEGRYEQQLNSCFRGYNMFKSYCLRAVNSIEFIGIVVFIAVVLTSGVFSVKAVRDPSIKQQSLVYSHLVPGQKPPHLPTRGIK